MQAKQPKTASLVAALATDDHLPHLQGMGRRERRAAETRLRLFRCALQLFAERGFWNVTIEDITGAADVGKGTFFNYFDSKGHVLSVMAEIQIGRVREALAQAETANQPVHLVLQQLFQRLAKEPGRSADLARTLISSFLASEDVRLIVGENMAKGRHIVARILELGKQNGEIDPRLKCDYLALLLQETVLGTILLWSLRGEPRLKTAMARSFQHFWRAIAAPGVKERR
jgi:AcrR family transcriptional regulator